MRTTTTTISHLYGNRVIFNEMIALTVIKLKGKTYRLTERH